MLLYQKLYRTYTLAVSPRDAVSSESRYQITCYLDGRSRSSSEPSRVADKRRRARPTAAGAGAQTASG